MQPVLALFLYHLGALLTTIVDSAGIASGAASSAGDKIWAGILWFRPAEDIGRGGGHSRTAFHRAT